MKNHTFARLLPRYLRLVGAFLLVAGFVFSSMGSLAQAGFFDYSSPEQTISPTSSDHGMVSGRSAALLNPDEAVSVFGSLPAKTTGDVYEISLEALGYGERVLHSPNDTVEYELRLPEGWIVEPGSSFELDMSYVFIGTSEWATSTFSSLWGDVTVSLRGQILSTWAMTQTTLTNTRIGVPLPPEILNSENRVFNVQVTFDLSVACNLAQDARLIIHPSSFFSLIYTQQPIVPDLSRYPRPFAQSTPLEHDLVRFVLPEQPTQANLNAAAVVAARLGRLAYGIAISGTTDIEAMALIQAKQPPKEHLILVGRPDTHALIAELARLRLLPVAPTRRQAILSSEGPAAVAPGETITFTVTLTHTGMKNEPSSLIDMLPQNGRFISCDPKCTIDANGQVVWPVPPAIKPGDSLSYTLVLRAGEVLTDSVLENTVTLLDKDAHPLNVNTLTTTVAITLPSTGGLRTSFSADEGFFFIANGEAVPEGDGIVQEIVSPWNPARAILVVTGVTDEAVSKASRALGAALRLPSLEGPFALVQDTLSPASVSAGELSVEQTLGDLGYEDRVLKGQSQEISYYFTLPPGWQLTTNAFLDLHFNHSALIDYTNSSLTVLLNGSPIATVGLSAETVQDGRLQANLSSNYVAGRSNRLLITAKMITLDRCSALATWVVVKQDSRLYLEHNQTAGYSLDLRYYPYPFDRQAGLGDTLYVLPQDALPVEWEAMLRVVAAMSQAARGTYFMPTIALVESALNDQPMLGDYHLVLVGRPTRNFALQQANSSLPQPFLPNSDLIEQRLSQVVLRLPPGLSLGYLQLIASPWNPERVLLAVTGTTDEGMQWAVDALANEYWSLSGNLSILREDQIQAVDTRLLTRGGVAMAVATAVPEMITATVTPPSFEMTVTAPISVTGTTATPRPVGTVTADEQSAPGWLVPFVAVMSVVIVGVLGAAAWQRRRRPGTER